MIKQLTVIFLLAVTFVSCSDTDTTKPVFELISPAEADTFYFTDTIIFRATFNDDRELNQYRVEVKNNFTEYPDSIIGWKMVLTDILHGTEETIELELVIPDTISGGNYFVMAKCLDLDGNEAAADTARIIIQ